MNPTETESHPSEARRAPRPVLLPKSSGGGWTFVKIRKGKLVAEDGRVLPSVGGVLLGHTVEWDKGNPEHDIDENWRLRAFFDTAEDGLVQVEASSNSKTWWFQLAEGILASDALDRDLAIEPQQGDAGPGDDETKRATFCRWYAFDGPSDQWVWLNPKTFPRRWLVDPAWKSLPRRQREDARWAQVEEAVKLLQAHPAHGRGKPGSKRKEGEAAATPTPAAAPPSEPDLPADPAPARAEEPATSFAEPTDSGWRPALGRDQAFTMWGYEPVRTVPEKFWGQEPPTKAMTGAIAAARTVRGLDEAKAAETVVGLVQKVSTLYGAYQRQPRASWVYVHDFALNADQAQWTTAMKALTEVEYHPFGDD